MGDYVAEAVQAASGDMARVAAAADAINGAIGKVRPWLTGQTWTGPAATAWEGEWTSLYNSVQSCLNSSLPSAEASVISAVRQQAEQQLKKDPALAHVS
jgi:uncharacterized protein YukE